MLTPHSAPAPQDRSWQGIAHRMQHQACVVVQVQNHEGSVPRERGAWMLIFENHLEGTIGGGRLELQAIEQAKALLRGATSANPGPNALESTLAPTLQHGPTQSTRFALGPSLGQCCGGVVWLEFFVWHAPVYIASESTKSSTEIDNRVKFLQNAGLRLPLTALFGGGHVGRAIVQVLSALPMPIVWIDSRDEIFPADLPFNVRAEHSAPVQAAVHDRALIASGSRLLVMSFSHAEDLEICAAALNRQRKYADMSFIGLIGSKTKWATFRKRLLERGFNEAELGQITCPIGIDSVQGKEPGVIAVAVAAQLLGLPTMVTDTQGSDHVLA